MYCSPHISWELRYATKADCHVCYHLLKYYVCLSLVHKHSTNTSRTKSLRSLIIYVGILYVHLYLFNIPRLIVGYSVASRESLVQRNRTTNSANARYATVESSLETRSSTPHGTSHAYKNRRKKPRHATYPTSAVLTGNRTHNGRRDVKSGNEVHKVQRDSRDAYSERHT